MGMWITLGILVLLGCIPFGVGICYDESGVRVSAVAGALKITLFPRRKKADKPPKEKKDTPEKKPKDNKKSKEKKKISPEKKETSEAPKKGGSIQKFLPFVVEGLHFLGDFRRKLRVNKLDLAITLAGGDPADLAINYSRAWAAIGNLQPQLNRIFAIKKQNVTVNCDFCEEKTTAYLDMAITITLGRVLGLVCKYGFRMGKLFFATKKKEKSDSSKVKDGK